MSFTMYLRVYILTAMAMIDNPWNTAMTAMMLAVRSSIPKTGRRRTGRGWTSEV